MLLKGTKIHCQHSVTAQDMEKVPRVKPEVNGNQCRIHKKKKTEENVP
jgi:hypothetical protein